MKQKTKYSDAPSDISDAIEKSNRVTDFLPPPEELIRREENVKITIHLSKQSVDFFKQKATDLGVPYQSMIKQVLDHYTEAYTKK